MQRKQVKGTTENLNMLNNKVKYIGFELGEVPEFLQTFEELNYRVPKVYDETTYKVYKYVSIDDIDILVTPTNRLDELEKKYKYASPLFTYMKAETNEDIEKYARFLKMINQTNLVDIEKIELEQDKMDKQPPFEVKYPGNFKWEIYYSDFADKYFMMASTEETDNSQLFYLLKKKIEANNDKRRKKKKIFIPISNEEYSERILKKSEIADLENYLWFFTKEWPSIYEVTDIDGELSLQIVGQAPIYDNLISKFNLKYTDKKEAQKEFKLIKALFILAYEIPDEFEFDTKIDENGNLIFCYEGEKIEYENLPEFMKNQAIKRIQENVKVNLEIKNLEADIIDMQRHSQEQNEEYLKKERQIYTFLECKKTFLGKVKYFFKSKKVKEDDQTNSISKDRMKDILSHDKEKEKIYAETEADDKQYTVEDMMKICKELNESIKKQKNLKMDIKALQNKIENLDRKIKNATQYIEEIEKHKKSIFEFWKFANKDEVKTLQEGDAEGKKGDESLKRTFNYDQDIDLFASKIDSKQRAKLTDKELNAAFAAKFVLDGINILSKDKIVRDDEEKIKNLLEKLQIEYKDDIERIEEKDFDIFGNISEDKTKIKSLKNNTHRENEKDKFKILNVNLNTQLEDFMEKLMEIKNILKEESNKIETPYDISVYQASDKLLETDGFGKFSLNPQETFEQIEKNSEEKELYLYKINIPEGTNLIFYTNIVFFENNNDTLPLGMDISQETLIDLDAYNMEIKDKEQFNINVCSEFDRIIRKVNVFEYNLTEKKGAKADDK